MKRSARSTRFPVALHIMCMLTHVETLADHVYVSSGRMAVSTQKNEATIRQIIGMLTKKGLVNSSPGSKGGARLAKAAQRITLLDIYRAVEHQKIFGIHSGKDNCLIANYVEGYLENLFRVAEEQIELKLDGIRLSDLGDDIYAQAVAENWIPPLFNVNEI